MADLVVTVFTSLDFHIAKPDGVFAPPPWSDEVEREWSLAALGRAAHLLYGRVNFLFNKGFWSAAETDRDSVAAGISYAPLMNALPKTVVSRTLSGEPGWNARLAGPDLAEEVARLKREVTGGDIFAFGGAGLSNSLFAQDLVDEFWLMVTPEFFGDGMPLFRPGRPAAAMRLIESRTLDVGSVILRYRRDRAR
jgi:dihydrofolate reductase